MSKKTTTTSNTSSNQSQQFAQNRAFDPAALGQYQNFQPQIAGVLGDYMSNPWQSGHFQQQLGRANEFIAQQGRTAQQALLGQTPGGGGGAFRASELARLQRGTQRSQSNALTNLLLGSSQLRLGAAGQAQAYQPLETGQSGTSSGTSTSQGREVRSEGGLGTWLPQVAGLALGALTGGMGGGGGMFGSLFGGGGAANAASNFSPGVFTGGMMGQGNALLMPNRQFWR